jgi:predicted  nucleic acid-binding Zn-ribbon protein
MMEKANFSVDNHAVKVSMPIAKVDEERRTVSGFASLDNLDKQGDVVTKEASVNAFNNFAGNIREQHDAKKAVGKMVDFKEDTYFDADTGKMYAGVYVSAYISKGAQDTWEKVLDGTLTGFSIAGDIDEEDTMFDGDLEKSIRVIKGFTLSELSLVDVPANQFANVLSIQKNGEVTGMLAKALIENVYYCGHDDVVQLSSTIKSACPRCSGAMENIGFVESNDPDKAQMVKGILTTVRKNKEVENMSESTEATPETPETVAETVEEAVEAVEEVKAEVEEAVEEAKEVVEETTEEATAEEIETVEMKIEALTTAVADISTQILEIKALADAVTKVYSQVGEVSKAVAHLNSEFTSLKATDQEFGKRVDAVEKETAFRKSADFGEIMQDQPEMVEKSLWGGRFLKKSDLF